MTIVKYIIPVHIVIYKGNRHTEAWIQCYLFIRNHCNKFV